MTKDLILYNANVYTMNDENTLEDAIVISDGIISKVGKWDLIKDDVSSHAKIIDLEGKTVIPGFIDAHQHIVPYGFNLQNVNCHQNSIEEVVTALEERSRELNDSNKWIIGYGLDEAIFKENRNLHKTDISHIQNPIYITRFCLHTAITNDKGIEIAQLKEDTPIGDVGRIEIDEEGITGVLREKAMDLISRHIPPYTKEDIKYAIELAQKEYIKQGITGVHEAGMGLYTKSINEFHALQQLASDGELNVRLYAMILEEYWDSMQQSNLLNNVVENDFFKLGSIKLFTDGALSSQTAAMKDSYVEPAGTHGIFMYTKEELEDKVLKAHKANKQVAIHAIGDAAVERVINIYEKVLKQYPRENHRHRIEHCGISNASLLKKMKKNNLTPVPHPGVFFAAGDIYKKVLKPEIFKGLYNVKSFIEAGLNPALSSDCPVVPSPPLYTIYAAVARETINKTPMVKEEAISIQDAVMLYTRNAARAAFNEKKQGQLKEGYYGDLVVLPEGFMNFTLSELKEAQIEMTIINGEVKYSAKHG